jgi:DnaJ-like protein
MLRESRSTVTGFTNAYDILGVSPQADDAVINAAHRALTKKLHPDLASTSADRARRAREMRDLNNARDTLLSAPDRLDLDRALLHQAAERDAAIGKAAVDADRARALRATPASGRHERTMQPPGLDAAPTGAAAPVTTWTPTRHAPVERPIRRSTRAEALDFVIHLVWATAPANAADGFPLARPILRRSFLVQFVQLNLWLLAGLAWLGMRAGLEGLFRFSFAVLLGVSLMFVTIGNAGMPVVANLAQATCLVVWLGGLVVSVGADGWRTVRAILRRSR